MLSIALIPIVLTAGGAVDYVKAVNEQSKLQAAADAAVLAGMADGVSDGDREDAVETYLYANMDQSLSATVRNVSFRHDPVTGSGKLAFAVDVPTSFLSIVGQREWALQITSAAAARPSTPRVLDVAMCIDITGSMQNTIDAVRARALSFESELNDALELRGLARFDAMRVRVLGYRDYGGNNPDYRFDHYRVSSGGYVDKYPLGSQWRGAGDARNYGDDVPMEVSAEFRLPAQAAGFEAFVNGLEAGGGGDYPESGLECVNAALNGAWIKAGDNMPGLSQPVRTAYSLIALWTDIDAQPPNFSWSLLNLNYPGATVMPRSYAGLRAKWDDPALLDQANKLIVTFMPSSGTPVWNNIKSWPNYFNGGTLSTGNTQMIARIADAIAALPAGRTLSLTQ